MKDFLDKAKVASRIIATLSPQTKIDVLHQMAQALEQNSARIIEENQQDLIAEIPEELHQYLIQTIKDYHTDSDFKATVDNVYEMNNGKF